METFQPEGGGKEAWGQSWVGVVKPPDDMI